MRARHLELFEILGGWVTDTDDSELQRLFGEGSHLHAWHAELWAQRAPIIPPAELDSSAYAPPVADVAVTDRAAIYRLALDRLLADHEQLTERLDPLLDPSTARTISLVGADLTNIRTHL
jgi:hypothetical protein